MNCEVCGNPPPNIAPMLAMIGAKKMCVHCAMLDPNVLRLTLNRKLRNKRRNKRKKLEGR